MTAPHHRTVTMPEDVSHHRLIARPPGLSGYASARWCSVSRKKTTKSTVVICSADDSPNLAHVSCIGTSTTFDCCQVHALREAQNILAPVVYQEADVNSQHCEDSTSQTETSSVLIPENEEEELLKLEPRTLVNVIKELRLEHLRLI